MLSFRVAITLIAEGSFLDDRKGRGAWLFSYRQQQQQKKEKKKFNKNEKNKFHELFIFISDFLFIAAKVEIDCQ